MRKLIEHEKSDIMCDNPECDFRTDIGDKDYKDFLNTRCPLCGENLLTEEDYKNVVELFKFINFVNKWFGWLTIFMKKSDETKLVKVHTHNGIKIEEKENFD